MTYDVVILLPGFDPQTLPNWRPPGGYVVAFRLLASLANAGFRVAAVAPNPFSPSPAPTSSIPEVENPVHSWKYLRSAPVELVSVTDMDAFPEAAWTVATAWTTANAVIMAGRKYGGKTAYLIQSHEDHRAFAGSMAQSQSAAASYELGFDKKLVVSEKMLERWPDAKVVHPGLDHETFHSFPVSIRPRTVLFAGTTVPYKGTMFGVDVVRKLPPDVEVRTYGNKAPYITERKHEHVKDPSDRKLAHLHALSEVFMCSSIVEGFTIPICEAMATGNLVATTDRSGHTFPKSLVEEFPFGDAAAGAAAIEKLCTLTPEEKNRRRATGREYTAQFTYERTYRDVVSALGLGTA